MSSWTEVFDAFQVQAFFFFFHSTQSKYFNDTLLSNTMHLAWARQITNVINHLSLSLWCSGAIRATSPADRAAAQSLDTFITHGSPAMSTTHTALRVLWRTERPASLYFGLSEKKKKNPISRGRLSFQPGETISTRPRSIFIRTRASVCRSERQEKGCHV